MTELNFHIYSSFFDSNIAPFAVALLGNNPHVNQFDLLYDSINAKGAEILGEIVRDDSSLVRINLQGSIHGQEGYRLLTSLVQSGVNNVSLPFCSICSSNGGTNFSDILATNTETESISLYGASLNDNDAVGIAAALATNTNLKYLSIDFKDGGITAKGKSALRNACFDTSSLISASNANHTCRINGYSTLANSNGNNGRPRKENRQMKIYHVLASHNKEMTNCKDLANVDIKLLPMILMSVKRYSKATPGDDRQQSNETKAFMRVNTSVMPLSIVYEILRNWDEVQVLFKQRAFTPSKRQKCSR